MRSLSPKTRFAAFLLGLSLPFTAASTTVAEVVLKIHHFLGEDSVPHRALIEPWARRVEKQSQGRIKLEIYPAMELGGKASGLVEQAQTGVVDIVWTAAAYTPGRFPRSEVFSLPLVHSGDPVATNLAIRQLMDEELAADYPNLKPLLVHVHQGHAFHMGSRPVTNVDEFSGLTLRPPGRGIGSWTIEALGAETTKKRHPKLPKAMAEKKLDGALMSFNLAESMGVIEASSSHTLLGGNEFFGTSIFLFLMNEQRYRSLPQDLRLIIDRNSAEAFAREMGEVWLEAGNAGINAARRQGNTINGLQGEAAARAAGRLQLVVDRWINAREQKGVDSARLIGKARRAIDRHSGN